MEGRNLFEALFGPERRRFVTAVTSGSSSRDGGHVFRNAATGEDGPSIDRAGLKTTRQQRER
jgi:hypothetical protein